MPDWKRLVDDRLANIQLAPDVREEVVAEIAAHLEECHNELHEARAANPEAQTLAQVSDWSAFRRQVQRAKEHPMSFLRRVVLPGAAAAIAAMLALKLMVAWLVSPIPCSPALDTPLDTLLTDNSACVVVSKDGPAYLPWLAMLLPIGALGAALSRRLAGRPVQRLIAALAPAIYLAGEIAFLSVTDAFYWRVPVYWVFIPALVCAVGAWPFLRDRHDAVSASDATAAPAAHPRHSFLKESTGVSAMARRAGT
jgi:hypothetical protein